MYALLSKGLIKEDTPDQIIVELKNGSAFNKQRLESKKAELQNKCKKYLGKELVINIVANDQSDHQKKNDLKTKQAAFNHPFVVEAQKMFNGEIIN